MRRILLAAALATTTAMTVPMVARSAPDTETQQAQAGPSDEHEGERLGGGPGGWMHSEGGPMMQGWRGRMMHRMTDRNPQERCEERLAWRAAMRAYTEAKLDLTPEQRPLWDKLQTVAQSEQQKERQLCTSLIKARRRDNRSRPARPDTAIPVDAARSIASRQTRGAGALSSAYTGAKIDF